jgi:hypothetical protein
MKNVVFWDFTSCGSCKCIVFLSSMLQLLVSANVVPSLPILITFMMEAILSSETLVLTAATWHNIPEDGILLCNAHLTKTLIQCKKSHSKIH